MERVRQLLLEVWREACRHTELDEVAASIARLLSPHIPLAQIEVWSFDRSESMLSCLAAAGPRESQTPMLERRQLSATDVTQFDQWTQSRRLLKKGKAVPRILALMRARAATGEVLAVPLRGKINCEGALVLVADPGRKFNANHSDVLDALREPFSVALENYRQLHELAALRLAAEADRGALLRRLGRTDLTDRIIGEQSGLRHVMDRVHLVARSDVPVLILGETGTGKELVARALHLNGPRPQGPFIRVNCGAIPADLIDSQLFGHEKGSFTGADQARPGWLERADEGTLFLDEIGELPLEAQIRFLRVLQDGFIERVGGTHFIHVRVRVVAATHRDLAHMVREGRFREDLWYRLAVFPILLPPLRDRLDDIGAFAEHFAERAAARFTLPTVYPTPADVALLKTYDWPGNVRELSAVIDRAAILGNGQSLSIAKALGLMHDEGVHRARPKNSLAGAPSVLESEHFPSLNDAMRAHIESALVKSGGRVEGQRGAAALLKINPHTLRARMRKLRIRWSEFRR